MESPKRFGSAIGLSMVILLIAAVYAPTMRWLVQRWSLGVWFQLHGFAVIPIAVWLAVVRLRALPPQPPADSRWGFLFLGAAVLLQVADTSLRSELLSAVSLFLAVPGLCLLFLGARRTRAIWFPLCFLGFAIPIPLVVSSQLHLGLRRVAAVGTERFLGAIGYDVSRTGTLLRVGPDWIQISDACSGFSTLTALTMIGLLVVYLSRVRFWRGALILALIGPLAAFCNVLRCVALCMLAAAYGTDILATSAHEGSGLAAFLVAMVLLLALDRFVLTRRGVTA